MPTLIANPTVIEAAGNKPKLIREYIGRVNCRTPGVSVAHMSSPGGWVEPGQTPDFEEYTLVLRGMLRVTSHHATVDVHAGQAVIAHQHFGNKPMALERYRAFLSTQPDAARMAVLRSIIVPLL